MDDVAEAEAVEIGVLDVDGAGEEALVLGKHHPTLLPAFGIVTWQLTEPAGAGMPRDALPHVPVVVVGVVPPG